jgi:uncharacterized protein with GYD domain
MFSSLSQQECDTSPIQFGKASACRLGGSLGATNEPIANIGVCLFEKQSLQAERIVAYADPKNILGNTGGTVPFFDCFERLGWCTIKSITRGVVMIRRILLMKLTDQGAKDIKSAPQRIEQAFATFEKMGGKLLGFYLVTGEYDYISIGEAPNDEVAMLFTMGLSALGNVRTTTIEAYTKEEFGAMVKRLP